MDPELSNNAIQPPARDETITRAELERFESDFIAQRLMPMVREEGNRIIEMIMHVIESAGVKINPDVVKPRMTEVPMNLSSKWIPAAKPKITKVKTSHNYKQPYSRLASQTKAQSPHSDDPDMKQVLMGLKQKLEVKLEQAGSTHPKEEGTASSTSELTA